MEPFTALTAIAAPLARANVDTEVIIPINRLIDFRRGQLGPFCFEPWRYDADGRPDATFVLNDPRYRDARILVAGPNFGCGSSREHAVWALWDVGIRVVIAESFGDIFRANCFQNGLLPVALPAADVARLTDEIAAAEEPRVAVDLVECRVTTPTGIVLGFDVDPQRREALLAGLDEVGLTLRHADEIRAFAARDRDARPWAYRPLELRRGTNP